MLSSIDSHDTSRRQFLRTIALGTGAAALFPAFSPGATPTPGDLKYYQTWARMIARPTDRKLGVALVGLGQYSTGQLGPALRETKLCRLAGIVTGSPEKEKKWTDDYSIPAANIYNYDSYDQLIDNPAIDIIYIVLPNSLHAEFTIRAAEAGKHVICEKPMATSVADAEAMITACHKHDRKLAIGYRLHYEPHHEEAMRLGHQELLGSVRKIEGDLSFRIGSNPEVWRLKHKLAGGGPLMDIGLYAIQSALYTIEELPVAVTARMESKNLELFSEVEESIEWEFEFATGRVAKGSCSYSRGANYHRVNASNGSFDIQPAYSYAGIQGRTSAGPMDFPTVNQQALQMDAFADHILNGAENRVPGEMGLRDTRLLYAVYEAAQSGRRVALDLG
jgi:predicted dehydrogenase